MSSSHIDHNTSACTWDLHYAEHGHSENVLMHQHAKGDGDETVLNPGKDGRKKVDPQSIKPGGIYRSIVKLQMQYERMPAAMLAKDMWYIGTGWLVSDDVIVTAGHCAYKWDTDPAYPIEHPHGYGRVNKIRVYIGYRGKESVSPATTRHGVRIVTTRGWMESERNKANDAAVIKLDGAFTGVQPYQIAEAPLTGRRTFNIAGYPGDRDAGAQLYDQAADTTFDLASSLQKGMLEYNIDTFGGQSGSPVIINGTNQVWGIHVYGDLGQGKNSASVFGGTFGNPVARMVAILAKNRALSYINVTASEQRPSGVKYISLTVAESALDIHSEEGFLDIFGKVANIGSMVLKTGAPLLGPVFGTVAGIAGAGLGIAGQIASKRGESFLPGTETAASAATAENYTARAIVAEATLQAVLSLPRAQAEKAGLLEKMDKHYHQTAHRTSAVIPHLAPIVGDAMLRALQTPTVGKYTNDAPVRAPDSAPMKVGPKPDESLLATKDLDSPAQFFYNAAIAHPTRVGPGQESILSATTGIIQKAFKVGRAALAPVGRGLVALDAFLDDEAKHTGESSLDFAEIHQLQPQTFRESLAPIRPGTSLQTSDGNLHKLAFHRAIMGEAALLAMQEPGAEHAVTESFLDTFKSTMLNIAGGVVKIAPQVLTHVAPLVVGLMSGGAGAAAGPGTRLGESSLSFGDSVREFIAKQTPSNNTGTVPPPRYSLVGTNPFLRSGNGHGQGTVRDLVSPVDDSFHAAGHANGLLH